MKKSKTFFIIVFIAHMVGFAAFFLITGTNIFGGEKNTSDDSETLNSQQSRFVFNADSAYRFCAEQCSFGPRVMNTEAHDKCGEWIKEKFQQYGLQVESQKADLKAFDGTVLKSENIIARLNPENSRRIIICAHWDTRPWADNDPNADNHRKPVMGANDGASGVGVMIELARMVATDSVGINLGIDFICFDAEDYGTPQWAETEDDSNSWALGSQHWAKVYSETPANERPDYEYGILLDMVGGEGARFYQEGISVHYAQQVVDKVWQAAGQAGYSSFFPTQSGGYVTDDHLPINQIAGIPCIDIINHYPDCQQSSFGMTWHTVNDTMEHISTTSLKAVGQTVAQVLCNDGAR